MRSLHCLRVLALLLVTGVIAIGCDSSSEDDGPDVDLDALFAAPTSAEIDAVEAEWRSRNVSAQNIQELGTMQVFLGTVPTTVRVVSHDVAGATHVGAILVPDGAAPGSLPVLVYSHGGDGGVSVTNEVVALATSLPDVLLGQSVIVVPAFRGEPLRVGSETFMAGGTDSPWDLDVDDALALLNVALETTPAADAERIQVLGFSRGAAVAMLMGIRDARIDRIAGFFGPTDFFGPFVQNLAQLAIDGNAPDLPGVDFVTENYFDPFIAGTLSLAEIRSQLVRRSSVYFAQDLPQLQVHHGTGDTIVPVGETERLNEVMQGIGRTAPAYESFIYQGGFHDPFTLAGSIITLNSYLSADF